MTAVYSTAIVPYSLASPFSNRLEAEDRLICLHGTDILIKQQYAADGKGGTDLGFGASVYNSSIVMADFLLQHGAPIVAGWNGAAALELGAGLGLASIALALALRGDSTLASVPLLCTDGEDMVVGLSAANAERNGIKASSGDTEAGKAEEKGLIDDARLRRPSLHCAKLYWGDAADEAAVLQTATLARGYAPPPLPSHSSTGSGTLVCLGCGSASPFNAVGFIHGADIVAVPYKDALLALVATLRRLMTRCHHCGGEVYNPSTARAADGAAGHAMEGKEAAAPTSPASASEARTDYPLLPSALPPASNHPVFLLAFQQRHHEERCFFEAMREFTDCYRVNRKYLHEDFRKQGSGGLPAIQLLWFVVKSA